MLDTQLLSRSLQFYCTVARLLLRSLLGPNYQTTIFHTDNSSDNAFENNSFFTKISTSKIFAAFPEFFLEDIAEIVLFVSQHHFPTVEANMDQDLVSLLLVVICTCSRGYVKNPYLTAKFVEVSFNYL